MTIAGEFWIWKHNIIYSMKTISWHLPEEIMKNLAEKTIN